tara:strand:- start:364 stop:663 length:300 start_codon:yes stop_codon:yes gene_type:complete
LPGKEQAMRYLILPIILSVTVACGDDTAKPKKRYTNDQDVLNEMDMDVDVDSDVECPSFECNRDKLINMIEVQRNFEYAMLGGMEFEPMPFEFRSDMGE